VVCAILTIGILFVQGIHQQLFEYIFLFFLAVMGVTFWINFMKTGVTAGEIFEGFIPTFHANQMGVSMSLFGAIVMPHNLYLQSSLVMTRRIENLNARETKRTVMFLRIETMIIMVMSFVINMAVIGSFTNMDTSSIAGDNFDFVSAGEVIKQNLGTTCQVLYGIGLFSSGMSSTTTGALTGQYVMNGYCKFKFNKKLRIFITRTIALVPCLLIVNFATMNSANSVMNTIQAIQLPFILIPLARYIRSKSIMNEVRFGGLKFGFILGTGILLIGLNVYNVLLPFISMGYDNWYVWTFMPVFSLYIGFLGFLVFIELDTRKFEQLNALRIVKGHFETENENGKVQNKAKKVGGPLTDPLLDYETPSKDNRGNGLGEGVDVIATSQCLDKTQEKVSDQIFVFD
jgi:Mn2+/Fe2+ NRAMP family transporter